MSVSDISADTSPDELDKSDLMGSALTADPLSYLLDLQAKDPVHWNDRHRGWMITRYEDVTEGFKDNRMTANRLKRYRETRLTEEQQGTIGRSIELLENWMVFQDDPEHRRLKGIVMKAFTPQMVRKMEDDIRELVREQIAELRVRIAAQPDKPIDFLNEMAYEIPGPIICKMLGVPQEDRKRFIAWTEQVSLLIGGFVGQDERYERAHEAIVALEDYLEQVIERSNTEDDNLMSKLVAAEMEGDRLSRREVIATGILVLFGGNRTTSCMIANGLRALMLHPEAQEKLRQQPELLNNAIEEIMRWESHTKFTVRIVAEDFEWHGKHLKAGQRVFLSPLAANHDTSMFEDPSVFDITRKNAPRHLAFGTGIHLCLGMALARLELKVVMSEMLAILPELKMVDPASEWLPTLINRVQKSMYVVAK